MLRVVIKKVGQDPVIENIEDSLEAMQAIVGGYIEVVPVGNLIMVCNEEGKIDGLGANFKFGDDIVVGDAFFTKGDDEDGFADLSDLEIQRTICFLKQVQFRRHFNEARNER